MRRSSLLLAIVLLLVFAAAAGGSRHTVPPCAEDEACWDCKTMGNRICGPEIAQEDAPTNGAGGGI